MKTITMEKPGKISLPDEIHPSFLNVGEYGIITKSVYPNLVGTLVISVWCENGVRIVSLENGSAWSFTGKVYANDREFKVKRVIIDQIVCHYTTYL